MVDEMSIWRPIQFNEDWLKVSTVKLDNIAPSWFRKRELFKENEKEYQIFLDRLKRQQAIETGIIERLYDLKEGITETFIKEGFIEAYVQHGDTNIPKEVLINYLKDHFDAVDFIFDFVKSNRSVSKGFMLELHQLITTHQNSTDAVDGSGRYIKVPLLKGQFKKLPNNPKRDEIKYIYCPPEQVDSEIDNLIGIYNSLEQRDTHAVIKAAFFHHALTQIHPFQDGNGRVARLMASLVLVKEGLFPFTLLRDEKREYIDSLENADDGMFQPIADLFSKTQIRNIERALNWKTVSDDKNYKQVVDLFVSKVKKMKSEEIEKRSRVISQNRDDIFSYSLSVLKELQSGLQDSIGEMAALALSKNSPNEKFFYYFSHQIAEYATQHKYYFNASLPRGWVKINIKISENRNYNLIVSLHHYGYEDSTLSIGAFLESKYSGKKNNEYIFVPLEIRPLLISAELPVEELKSNIRSFLQDVLSIALGHILNEI